MTKDTDLKTGQEVTGRVCTKCHTFKLFAEFNKKTKAKYGVYNECRECQKVSNRIAYEKNPAPRIEAAKARREANPEQRRVWDAAYRARNPEKVKESVAKHYENNPEALERRKLYAIEWRKANPEKVKETSRRAEKKRKERAEVRIHGAISRAIRASLHAGAKAGRKTFDILGYSREDLMRHLEGKFQPGMTWENYGLHGWHIDHKIPKSLFSFNTTEDEEFKRCWDLSNLQPMWATENRMKFNKYDGPRDKPANDNNVSGRKNGTA